MEQHHRQNIILQAITGSWAYGLETKDSDIDRLGVFQTPTAALLGIYPIEESIVTTSPDVTLHELGKFVRLAMKANPTVLELLYLDEYEVLRSAGQRLIDYRKLFLSQRIRQAYGGYALDQMRRIYAHADVNTLDARKRRAKLVRHCFRLLRQGREVLESGTLNVRVGNREELFTAGTQPVAEIAERFDAEFKQLNDTRSRLPEQPDYEGVNALLLDLRRAQM